MISSEQATEWYYKHFMCCGREIPANYPPTGNVYCCPDCWEKRVQQRQVNIATNRLIHESSLWHMIACRLSRGLFCPYDS